MSAFSGRLPENLQDIGLAFGIAAIAIGAISVIWHWINNWRASKGRARLVLEPIHLLGAGLLLALVGVGWQMWKGPASGGANSGKITEIESVLDRLVSPRQFTDEQAQKLEEFLLKREKHKIEILYIPSNQEAAEYAAKLFNAFRNAEWEASIFAAPHDRTMNEGVEYRIQYPPDAPPSPTTGQLLQRALEHAGVPLRGGGSSRQQDFEETKVFLYVGHRPRI
ncbi:MAG: hypothetical protein JJ855_17375 [Rhodospirillales bacterium]|nr:hypothetical protein [Rhodospirillales bacterium]